MNKADVLWVRHCESCSNIRNPSTEALEKYRIPPLCTPKGLSQSLEVARRICALATSLRVDAADIDIYCSYLPRAMLTAILAASALRAITPSPRRTSVKVLCHVGELPNSYEREHADACVLAQTESTATAKSTRCWIRHFNRQLKARGLQVRLRAPAHDCASAPCRGKKTAAWRWDGGDYPWVLHELLPRWLQDGQGKLRVVVSHGAYIQNSLFHSKARMDNTSLVLQRYSGVGSRFVHADPAIDYGNDSPAFSPDEDARDALDALETWAHDTWADGCSWKSKATAWSECLRDARAAALTSSRN